jgi:hypothetical protein
MPSLLEHDALQESLVQVSHGTKTESGTNNSINQGMALSIGTGTVGVVIGGPIGGLVGALVGVVLLAAVKVAHAVRK